MKPFPLRTTLAAVTLVALTACATQDAAKPWRIEPLLRVQHSADASAAFYRTGRYYDGMRRWALAADEYRKATIADPRNADAFNALGVALARLGDHTGAENRLRQALALQPDRADIRANLGLLLAQAGRPTEAESEVRMAAALDGDIDVTHEHLRRAQAHGAAAYGPALQAAPTRAEVRQDPPATGVAEPHGEPGLASAPAVVAMTASAAIQVFDQPSVTWRDAFATPVPDDPHKPVRLEITNGNGTPGAAARLRQWLAGHGQATQRLSNRKPYAQPATVIEYRDGHEAQARQLAGMLPMQVLIRPGASLRTDLRVVLGHDWQRMAAALAVMRVAEARAGR